MSQNTIASQIQALRGMTVAELREKYLELFGGTETNSRHKDQLFRRLAWRVQELAHGGISDRAKRRAEKIANDLDARILPPRKSKNGGDGRHKVVRIAGQNTVPPAPGTILTREYRGDVHHVSVLEDGFEHQGKVYRSLSGVAKDITGTHWNGNLFFGLKKRGKANGQD